LTSSFDESRELMASCRLVYKYGPFPLSLGYLPVSSCVSGHPATV
jgi:hypothetical protein